MILKSLKAIFGSIAATISALCHSAPAPTERDIPYNPTFDRCRFDIWMPESDSPTPAVIFFHGGGFVGGSKEGIAFRDEFLALSESKKIAIISAGYPFLGDEGQGKSIGPRAYEDIDPIFPEILPLFDYLRENAERFNLNPDQFMVAGSSAGAVIAEFLAYGGQVDLKTCLAIQQPHSVERVAAMMKTRETPLVLYTRSGPDDEVHNPLFASEMRAFCDREGIPSYLFGTLQSGLPSVPEDQDPVTWTVETIFLPAVQGAEAALPEPL